nr:immunoglobulin heavy chain junction region [Macaca mulatta]MOV38054.1 immunoglobulin heavy chain junction region [Macaca mulatta]MOV38674.1 immunoglobulin heavy chain junction region [Macaca mulatta]MOV39795.1 immunoglobulin heavy chain junction region [Macaca mulatta]MOV39858.1 immunoglobulin heavy chain junction region [Macaca mulatta]
CARSPEPHYYSGIYDYYALGSW